MRTGLLNSAGLHLSIHNTYLSDCRSSHQIDPVEERIVFKFFFLKSLGYKVMDSSGKDGNLLSEDKDQAGRPLPDLTHGIRRRVEKFLFASALTLARYFSALCLQLIKSSRHISDSKTSQEGGSLMS
jgi:hypothetical protein